MYWTRKHVVVCTASHCAQKGANEVIGKLRLDVVRKGLDAEILINNCGTIDLCDIGPNMVVYPDNVILTGVTTKDVPRVLAYLRGGDLPDDLETSATSPAEAKRRELYIAATATGAPTTEPDFEALAAEYGYDSAWIDEQARRGFIARKPDPDDETRTLIQVTKKSRDRYRLAA